MSEETKVYGATDWNQETNKKREDLPKLNWMKLKPGPNKVRTISKPHSFHFHNVKVEGEAGFGKKVYCTGQTDCPVCLLGLSTDNWELKSQQHWLVAVINRATKATEVLEIGKSVYEFIKTFNQDEEYGDPQKYDINIKKNPKNPPASYYHVTPYGLAPLTPEDLALKEAFDFQALQRKCLAPTAEGVQKQLDKLLEGGKKIAKPAPKPEKNGPGKAEDVVSEKSEEETPQFLEK